MLRRFATHPRNAGFSLLEMLIALLLASILMAALASLNVAFVRFRSRLSAARAARESCDAALRLIETDVAFGVRPLRGTGPVLSAFGSPAPGVAVSPDGKRLLVLRPAPVPPAAVVFSAGPGVLAVTVDEARLWTALRPGTLLLVHEPEPQDSSGSPCRLLSLISCRSASLSSLASDPRLAMIAQGTALRLEGGAALNLPFGAGGLPELVRRPPPFRPGSRVVPVEMVLWEIDGEKLVRRSTASADPALVTTDPVVTNSVDAWSVAWRLDDGTVAHPPVEPALLPKIRALLVRLSVVSATGVRETRQSDVEIPLG